MSSEISTVSLSFLSELAMHPCSEALSTLWRVNGMNSFQLFVVELDTCLVWGLRLVPSNAQTAPKGMATDGDTLRGVISPAWMPTIGPEALSTLWRVNSPNKLFSQEILHETLAHTKEVAALISQMDRKKEREKQRESPFFPPDPLKTGRRQETVDNGNNYTIRYTTTLEIYSEERVSSIFRQSSNPVSGFSMMVSI